VVVVGSLAAVVPLFIPSMKNEVGAQAMIVRILRILRVLRMFKKVEKL
jgi:hypothetical protein